MKILLIAAALMLGRLAVLADNTSGVPLSNAQSISFNEMPETVQRTLKSHAGTAFVIDVQKGMVMGEPVYSGMFFKDGKLAEVLVTENGSIFTGRSQVAWNELPSAVQESFRSLNNRAALQSVMAQNQNGRMTYEFSLNNQGQSSQLQLAEDGKILGVTEARGTIIAESAGTAREEPLTFNQLTTAAQNTIKEISGAVPLEKIQAEVVNGVLHYEVSFRKDKQPMKICVSSNGQVVK